MISRSFEEALFTEAIDVLSAARSKIVDGSDLTWVYFESPKEFRAEIDQRLLELRRKEIKAIEDVYVLFLATGAFQEHAMANDWSPEYMELAERFDRVYEQAKQYG